MGSQRECALDHGSRRSRSAARCAALLLLWLAVTTVPGHAELRGELAQARHDLAISEQVLARVTQRVEAARADPAIEPAQREHLDQYLARVQRLVALNRQRVQTLMQEVDALPAGAPAPASLGMGVPGVATEAEEIAALEEKLGGSLAEFDQLLLEEARRARTRAFGGAGGGGGDSAGSSGGASGGNGTESGAPEAGGAEATASSADAPGSDGADRESAGEPGSPEGRILGTDPGASGASAAAPPDVGDGHDDDIVARQIRKAAESETDPELRDKLWEEYRRYKGAQR